jgi:hypothetical protein
MRVSDADARQTARISLHKPDRFKEPSSDKKRAIRQFLAYPFAPCLQIFRPAATSSAAFSRHRCVSASVRGYLRSRGAACKGKKREARKIFVFMAAATGIRAKSWAWRKKCHKDAR